MRALVMQDYWQLAVEDRPDPLPEPGEVLIRITATGICGSDVHGFTGDTGRRKPGQIMGHETVGRIEAVGPDVSGLEPGDVVTVNPVVYCGSCATCQAGREGACPKKSHIGVHPEVSSAFAELMVAPARNVVALPSGMPEEYGALVEPLAVGWHAAQRGSCTADDRVLVLGGGPIGQACVLAARRLGAERVVVSEPDERRHELLKLLGAVPVVPTELASRVEVLLGEPPSLVLDAVGSSSTLADACAVAAPCARIVFVGMAAPKVELDAFGISVQERTLVGSFCYSAREFVETASWVGTAPSELAHLIDGRVGLDAAPAAFTEVARGASAASKVLVYLGSDPTTRED